MNILLASYITAAIQVTLLSLFALVLHRTLARRCATTAVAIVVTTSIFTIALTVLNFAPLPESWSIANRSNVGMTGDVAGDHAEAVDVPQARPRSSANGLDPMSLLQHVDSLVDRIATSTPQSAAGGGFPWQTSSVVIIITATSLLLLRLVTGICAAQRLLKAATPIVENSLRVPFQQLRQRLGVTRDVALLTSPAVSSAATIGWRRPAVLLTPSWREWSDVELTAVLAHELTHVQRRDYPLGIVVRLATLLHFYNPLVRWLQADMFFAQEAAADDAAAQVVGSRQRYLVALSKLALHQDRQLASLPVLAFSFTSDTFLMRRIKMLETKDGQRRSSRAWRGLVIGCLVTVAIVTSTLRRPAHSDEPQDKPVRTAKREKRNAAKPDGIKARQLRPSLDLTYVPADGQGIVAIRPSVIFGREDMQVMTALIDAAIQQKVSSLGVEQKLGFSVADLSQAVGPIEISYDPEAEEGQRGRIAMTLSAIRSEQPVPLPEIIEATTPGATVTRGESGTVVETPQPIAPALGPMRHLALPDEQTVLPGISAAELERLKSRPAEQQITAKPWFGLWQELEQNMFAALVDNSHRQWDIPAEKSEDPSLTDLITHTEQLGIAADWKADQLHVQLIIECRDASNTPVIVAAVKAIAQKMLDDASQTDGTAQAQLDPIVKLYNSAMLKVVNSTPTVDDTRVTFTTSTRLGPDVVARYATAYVGLITGSTAESAERE